MTAAGAGAVPDAGGWLCRDCPAAGAEPATPPACPACGGRRLAAHPVLHALAIAHVDCDAFFASVEKARDPALAARPVVVGGGRRGVVSAACYVARTRGVRSAMPMFRALALCPDAVVIAPDLRRYAEVARDLRARMEALTPLVRPLSIDEAVLDLSGTAALHRASPAMALARFARGVERDLGLTVSVGLAPNRLLAKLAAERDKPRGLAALDLDGGRAWLAGEAPARLPGVGPALARRLAASGVHRLGQIQGMDAREAARRFGEEGPALAARARGEDPRPVEPRPAARGISAETTFEAAIRDPAALEGPLWRMCERLAARLAAQGLAAGGVVLKLRTAAFALRTRAVRLPGPTRLPATLFDAALPLLRREADGTAFRLIGVGAQPLAPPEAADRGDLADPAAPRRAAGWAAVEALRARFGAGAVVQGRALRPGGGAGG